MCLFSDLRRDHVARSLRSAQVPPDWRHPVRRTLFTASLSLPLLFGLTVTSVDAQWRYPPVYYPGAYRYEPDSSLKFSIKPKDASIYVDGYFAGKVEDYNGAFQRL